MKKFELGPMQKEWIRSLREHPERQAFGCLGEKHVDGYKVCCLGEALCVINKFEGVATQFNLDEGRKVLFDGEDSLHLSLSYKKIGLRSKVGEFKDVWKRDGGGWYWYANLAEANDQGVTWPEIADYIESNPENVFTEPK